MYCALPEEVELVHTSRIVWKKLSLQLHVPPMEYCNVKLLTISVNFWTALTVVFDPADVKFAVSFTRAKEHDIIQIHN